MRQKMFQSTLPQGERLILVNEQYIIFLFQSTLPQGERPALFTSLSVTSFCFNPRSRKGSVLISSSKFAGLVSIHAPARGATALCKHRLLLRQFQSTLPQGERQSLTVATIVGTCFNPRSRKGSDQPCLRVYLLLLFVSIHAPARGASLSVTSFCFNPRSRKGSDVGASGSYLRFLFVSIHAPARGATPQRLLPSLSGFLIVSIHAPARGATVYL